MRRALSWSKGLCASQPLPLPVERLWNWRRQELTYLHCHADPAELTDRIAAFVERLLDTPQQVHRRLAPKLHLDPDQETAGFSVDAV